MANNGATVRQWNSNGVVSGPIGVTFIQNVLSNTSFILCSLSLVNTETITSISDSRGSTYTELFDSTVDDVRFEVWTAPSGGSGANTITVTYSATTGARRIWGIEVGDLASLTLGPTDTHDQTTTEDPMTLASVTTVTECGIAVLMIATDTASSPAATPIIDADSGNQSWTAMGSGGSSQGYFKNVGPDQPNITPTADYSSAESGESALVCISAQAPAAAGGAHFSAFVG